MTDRAKENSRSGTCYNSYAALSLALMLSASCAAPSAVLRANPDISCVTQSSIDETLNPEQKVIVASFLFREGSQVQAQEALVVFGKTRTPISQGCNISFVLVGTANEVLARYGIWDPRVQVLDEGAEKGLVVASEASYTARFPFSPKAKEIRVLDNRENLVSTTDLSSPIRAFCGEHKQDQDCQSFK